jgi:hypothetical protein
LSAPNTILAPPPYQTPISADDGELSGAWLNWMKQLYLRVGAGNSPSNSAIVTSSSTTITGLQASITSINSSIASINSSLTTLNNLVVFQSVTVSYSQLQTAALTNAVQLFQMPARSVLKNVIIKHSTNFSGGSISDVYAQVGTSGNYGQFINNFDIFQIVGDQVFDNVLTNYLGSFANPTSVYLNAVATGANLSALTQGSVTVNYQYQTF